jgi:hypothetical protein
VSTQESPYDPARCLKCGASAVLWSPSGHPYCRQHGVCVRCREFPPRWVQDPAGCYLCLLPPGRRIGAKQEVLIPDIAL